MQYNPQQSSAVFAASTSTSITTSTSTATAATPSPSTFRALRQRKRLASAVSPSRIPDRAVSKRIRVSSRPRIYPLTPPVASSSAVKRKSTSMIRGVTNRAQQRPKRKTYIVSEFKELADEYQKRVVKAGLTPEDVRNNFEIVLNILHFKTKNNFYTPEQFRNRAKNRNIRRYNRGPSLVHPAIISVRDFQYEAEHLFSTGFKQRNYHIRKQIGNGGFGKVFLVKSVEDDKKLALKCMPHLTPKQCRKNFQEIRFLRYCQQHPNIVRYVRSYNVHGEVWLLTEYLRGGTLTQVVALGSFGEEHIAYVADELLKALVFLHENQMAHRDLKSGNVMLDTHGNVKLIDFGLCSDISQGEVTHMVGSPFWMPPEMIVKRPHGLPVDIWSFGICILELANGSPPHKKSAIKAMFAATQGYKSIFDDEDKWSVEFENFVRCCLRRSAKKRLNVFQLQKHPFLKHKCNKAEFASFFRTLYGKKHKHSDD